LNKKHQKHTNLSKPKGGQFHRREWAILGTNCNAIKKLSKDLYKSLQPKYKVGYVDADHQSGDEDIDIQFNQILMDRINFFQFQTNTGVNSFHYKEWLSELDLVLVNGNHFAGIKQIVVLDPAKKESLQRKLDRLDQVVAFIKTENDQELFDFLKEKISNWNELPILDLKNVDKIADLIRIDLYKDKPELFGLILAGGKSTRMGVDKGGLMYHGLPQREYAAQLASKVCKNVFLSCRPDQEDLLQKEYPAIPDTFVGLGPYGGILSAFREYPDVAWLIMACDLPLVNEAVLGKLVENRDPGKIATAFHNPATNFPDPLLTIWEPRAYPRMLSFLAEGYSCPRKVLINSNIAEVDSGDGKFLRNANTPEEAKLIKDLLDKN
jgi:molybdopterin-guanine dinucleotide biosynthesis protein A